MTNKFLHFVLAFATGFAPAISIAADTAIQSDRVKIGRKNSSSKELIFDMNAGNANPRLKTDSATGKLQFSNDGSVFKDIGSGSGAGSGINLLDNADLENGITSNFTNSGGTYTAATSGANLLFDKTSAVFTASASGQYVQSSLITVPQGLGGGRCLARIWFKGGDANYRLQVVDASGNEVIGRTFERAAEVARPFAVNFTCGAADTQYRLRLSSLASGSAVAFDRVHLGEADNLGAVATRNLGEVFSTSLSTCPAGSIPADGSAIARSTALGQKLIADGAPHGTGDGSTTVNVPNANGVFIRGTGSQAIGGVTYSGTLGTKQGDQMQGHWHEMQTNGGSGGSVQQLQGSATATFNQFSQNGMQGFGRVTGALSDGTNGTPRTGSETRPANIALKYCIQAEGGGQLAFTPEVTAWRVSANIAGGNPSLGLANVTSYSEITNGSLTLTPNPGSVAVGIACTTGTASTIGATTCGAANESVGVTFDVPAVSDVKACATFTHAMSGNTGSNLVATFQIVETTASSSTIVQEGGERVSSGLDSTATGQNGNFPQKVCGTFKFSTPGQKTVRLQYEQYVSASPLASNIMADASPIAGQRDIHWEIYPLNQQVPAPVLVGPFEKFTSKNSSYAILPSDSIVELDTTSGAVTATLPSAVGLTGKIIRITKKNSESNMITVQASGSEKIGYGTQTSTKLHARGETIQLFSDGSNWQWLSPSERSESIMTFAVCTTATCTTSRSSGNWGSLTRNAIGEYNVVVPAGIFTDVPRCICSATTTSGASHACSVRSDQNAATQVRITTSSGTTPTDSLFTVACDGPR